MTNSSPISQMQSRPQNPKLSKVATPGMNGSQVWSSSSHLQGSAPARDPAQTSHLPEQRTLSLLLTAMGQQTAPCTRAHIIFHPFFTHKYNKMHYMVTNLQVGIRDYKFWHLSMVPDITTSSCSWSCPQKRLPKIKLGRGTKGSFFSCELSQQV